MVLFACELNFVLIYKLIQMNIDNFVAAVKLMATVYIEPYKTVWQGITLEMVHL